MVKHSLDSLNSLIEPGYKLRAEGVEAKEEVVCLDLKDSWPVVDCWLYLLVVDSS